jgi:hypothetical protein
LFAERDLNRVVPQGAHLALRATLTRWVRIAISQAAFDAIAATLGLGTVAVEPERDEDGSVHIWLDPGVRHGCIHPATRRSRSKPTAAPMISRTTNGSCHPAVLSGRAFLCLRWT